MREYNKVERGSTPYIKYLIGLEKKGKLTTEQSKQLHRFLNIPKGLYSGVKTKSGFNYRDFKIRPRKYTKPSPADSGKMVPCDTCNKFKYVVPSLLKEYKWHFCNKKCQDKFYRSNSKSFKK